MRRFGKDLNKVFKWCRSCIYCISANNRGKFICGKDTKTYNTEFIDEYGRPLCSCFNGGYIHDDEKFNGRY